VEPEEAYQATENVEPEVLLPENMAFLLPESMAFPLPESMASLLAKISANFSQSSRTFQDSRAFQKLTTLWLLLSIVAEEHQEKKIS